jgi:tetratricopeptide (TPR) repeat protein
VLIDSGALSARLAAARARQVPVLGERAFTARLEGRPAEPATLPLATALSGTGLSRDDAEVLAAFDLIGLGGDHVRFGDAQPLRTAGELVSGGARLSEAVRILARARDSAPRGRHRIVLTPAGEAALQWDDGRSTLEGQGVLPLDEEHASVEELFEAAGLAEADGETDEAARLYDLVGRVDRKDPIAPYNLGNLRLAEGAFDQAVLAYQQALARDPRFAEARYNLAQALEASGKTEAAAAELIRILDADPAYSDAVFNLAQLSMQAGDMAAAKGLYERYLALDPPEDWAQTARKALLLCRASLG